MRLFVKSLIVCLATIWFANHPVSAQSAKPTQDEVQALTVKAAAYSASAKEKIEKAGGKAEVM